jgi:hypothetical protein
VGEDGSVYDKAAPEVAASMRRLLAAIDAGEMVLEGLPQAAAGCGGSAGGHGRLWSGRHRGVTVFGVVIQRNGRSWAGHAEGLGDGGQGRARISR